MSEPTVPFRIEIAPTSQIQTLESALSAHSSLSNPRHSKDTLISTTRLYHIILKDKERYQKLLKTEGSDAQLLLDVFQWLLDEPSVDDESRSHLIAATQRLTKNTGFYPVCYRLNGLTLNDDDVAAAGGGFADIYKAIFEGQTVCLKTIRVFENHPDRQEHVIKKFSNEVTLWAQLSHPNVLPMYGLYYFKKRPCIVTPWMENGEITVYLRANPKADRLLLIFDIAKGLLYLHSEKIVHGDLKGPNILIGDDGRALLCDFGIASLCDSDIRNWTSQSGPSSKGGTVRWQAPELLCESNNGNTTGSNSKQNATESDVYALGCVFYEVYTQKVPFHEIKNKYSVNLRDPNLMPSKPEPDGASWREWGLTESIWSLMEDCWKTEATERPTAQEVVNRLSLLLGHVTDRKTHTSQDTMPVTQFRRSMSIRPDVAAFNKIFDSIIGAK